MIATWMSAFGMVLSAALVAMTALALVAAWQMRKPSRAGSIFAEDRAGTAFLFHGDRLLDATPDALTLLPDGDASQAWSLLLGKLGPIFPGLVSEVGALARTGKLAIASAPDVRPAVVLRGLHVQGLTRLTLEPAGGAKPNGGGDVAAHSALLH